MTTEQSLGDAGETADRQESLALNASGALCMRGGLLYPPLGFSLFLWLLCGSCSRVGHHDLISCPGFVAPWAALPVWGVAVGR